MKFDYYDRQEKIFNVLFWVVFIFAFAWILTVFGTIIWVTFHPSEFGNYIGTILHGIITQTIGQ